LNTCGI